MHAKSSLNFPRLYDGLIIGVPPAVRQMTVDKIQQLGILWPKRAHGPVDCFGAGDVLCWYASVSVLGETMGLFPPFSAPNTDGAIIRPSWSLSYNTLPSKMYSQWRTIWENIYDEAPGLQNSPPVVNFYSLKAKDTIWDFIQCNNLAIAGGANRVGHLCEVPIGFTPLDTIQLNNRLYWNTAIRRNKTIPFFVFQVTDIDVVNMMIDGRITSLLDVEKTVVHGYAYVYRGTTIKFRKPLNAFLKSVQLIPEDIDSLEFRDRLGCTQSHGAASVRGAARCTHSRTKRVFVGCAGAGEYVTVCEDCKKEV